MSFAGIRDKVRAESRCRSPTASRCSSARTCSRSARWPTRCASACTATAPSSTATCTSTPPTSARPSCMFCSFARLQPGDKRRVHDDARRGVGEARARVAAGDPITEIHIVNGLHPACRSTTTRSCWRASRRIQPTIHLKAFTAVEIYYFAKKFAMPVAEVLAALRAAGLDSMPGRRRRDLRAARAQEDLRRQVHGRRVARRPPHRAPGRAAIELHDAVRARSRPSRSASITCCSCARCRTRPAASRRSSRWRSTPTTTR